MRAVRQKPVQIPYENQNVTQMTWVMCLWRNIAVLADLRLGPGMRSIVAGLDSKRSLVKISKKINKVALKIIKTKQKIIKSLTNNTTTGFNLFGKESK